MTSIEIVLAAALASAVIIIVVLLNKKKTFRKEDNRHYPIQREGIIGNDKLYTTENLALKLKLALDTSDASVWSFNIKNQTFSPLYGQVIAPEGTTFQQCHDLLHEESREIYLKIFDNLTSGTTTRESAIYHFIDPGDGSDKYYVSEMASITAIDGTIIEIIGTQKDITLEHQTKQELTQQLNLLNTIFDNMPAGMAYIDKNGLIIKDNQVGVDMFSMNTLSHAEKVNVFTNPNLPEDIKNILREGRNTNTLITHYKEAGTKKTTYIDFRANEIKTSDGKTEGYLCICSDITELMESNKKNEELSRRYEALFRSITSGVEIRDNNWNIIDSNEANFELFGVIDREAYLSPERRVLNSPIFSNEIKEKLKNYEPFTSYIDFDFDKANASGYFKSSKKGKMVLEMKFTPLSDNNGNIIGCVILSSDVTENTLLNKKYEDLYRQQITILRMLPIGVHIYNGEGLLIYQSDMSKKLFGANLAYQINIFDNPNIPNDIKEKIRLGEDQNMELEYDFEKVTQSNYFNTKLTGIKYFNGLSTAVRDENGVIQYYAHIIQDITESIKAKREINDINNKLSMAVGNSSVLPWDYDCVKQEFTPYYAYNQSNTFTYSLECVHPDDYKEAERIQSIIEDRRDESFKADIRYKLAGANEWQCGTIFGQPYEYDKHGNVTKYTGFRKDVTRWKTMTDQLESLIRQNKLMLNNTQSALIYFDANYKIQWENVSYVFGNFPKAAIYKTGLTCYKDIKGYDSPCKGCALTTAVNTKNVSSIQLDIDGMVAEMIATPILDTDNKLEGVVMRIDDITERKHTSDELKAAKEKAEQSNQLKSAFLANMSHEIRTPLNAIVGFANIVANAETEEEKAEYTKIISMNSDLLLNLINDILDLSKIESGYLEMHPDTIDFTEIFHELHLSFAMRMKENVELKCVSPYANCITSTLDKQRVLQIMTNFTSNAIKFTKAGSITIGYEYSDNGVLVYVSDTGIGISKENQTKVFQRFQKFDTFTQGTGLGLSICKAITEAIGGKIGFESEEGKGSTFWAWLPCKAQIKNLV